MTRKLPNSQINYSNRQFDFFNVSISRRRLLKGCFILSVALGTSSFKPLSKTAKVLLISLSEFDETEGARIDDLIYVSKLNSKQLEKAAEELVKLSLLYCKGQGQSQRFFFLQHPH